MSRTISILSHISGSCMVVKWVRSLRNVLRSFELVLIERSDGVSVPLNWMRFCSADTKFYMGVEKALDSSCLGYSCALAPHLGDDVTTCRAHLIQITELTLPGLLACLTGTRLGSTHRHVWITRRRLRAMRHVRSMLAMLLMWMMPHIDAFAMIHTPGRDKALHHNADHNCQGPRGDQQATIAGWRRGMWFHVEYLKGKGKPNYMQYVVDIRSLIGLPS